MCRSPRGDALPVDAEAWRGACRPAPGSDHDGRNDRDGGGKPEPSANRPAHRPSKEHGWRLGNSCCHESRRMRRFSLMPRFMNSPLRRVWMKCLPGYLCALRCSRPPVFAGRVLIDDGGRLSSVRKSGSEIWPVRLVVASFDRCAGLHQRRALGAMRLDRFPDCAAAMRPGHGDGDVA